MSSYWGQKACGRTAAARRVQVLNRTSVNTEGSVLIWWWRPSAIVRGLGTMAASANDQVMNVNNNPSIPLTRELVDSDCHTLVTILIRLLTRLTRLICLFTLLIILLIQYDSFGHLNTKTHPTHITYNRARTLLIFTITAELARSLANFLLLTCGQTHELI